ncbi:MULTISPECIES: hypothetical protein [Mucilaginibacter]|uniref:Uncharacterized protein n=1 Tax=Mucilaginibacter gossypii TaxID=551996 RepID=A0A1G8MUR7_9SPHI|nr:MULTISPECIES: hypothetical protein [Mucilaginibacter]WDZ98812.1 hypothetical protein MusilaSJ_15160 [Mucilaginibacter sp. SJ]SDI71768.1 hypothetical protein SAMN05192573_12920 [Mucilaginibacter gossypii]
MSATIIKYLIVILMASLLFACVAEAQTDKQPLQVTQRHVTCL